jgi:hypothetical protein
VQAGIPIVEVSLTVPDALSVIAARLLWASGRPSAIPGGYACRPDRSRKAVETSAISGHCPAAAEAIGERTERSGVQTLQGTMDQLGVKVRPPFSLLAFILHPMCADKPLQPESRHISCARSCVAA